MTWFAGMANASTGTTSCLCAKLPRGPAQKWWAAHGLCSPLPAPRFSAVPGVSPAPSARGLDTQTPRCPRALRVQAQAGAGHAGGAARQIRALLQTAEGSSAGTSCIGVTRDFPLAGVFQLCFTSKKPNQTWLCC